MHEIQDIRHPRRTERDASMKLCDFYFICSVDSRPMTTSSTQTHHFFGPHCEWVAVYNWLCVRRLLRWNICCIACTFAHETHSTAVVLTSLLIVSVFLFLWSIDVDDKQNRFVRNRFMARRRVRFVDKSVCSIWFRTICYDLLVLCWRVSGISAPIRFETIKLYLMLNVRSHETVTFHSTWLSRTASVVARVLAGRCSIFNFKTHLLKIKKRFHCRSVQMQPIELLYGSVIPTGTKSIISQAILGKWRQTRSIWSECNSRESESRMDFC